MATQFRNAFANARGSAVLRRTVTLSACVAAFGTPFGTPALAASGTWTGGGGDGLWANALNWTALPGVADGTFVSPDVATFDASSPAATVAIDNNRNVAGITYDSSTAGFTIGAAGVNGGPALHLTNGGLTQLLATVQPAAAQSFTFNAPVLFAGTSYTLAHNSSSTMASLVFRGNVSSTAAGATTLTLDGTHFNGAGSNAQIRGAISDGASGTMGIVKQGTGWWQIQASSANPNTYSGDTVINAGTLRIAADTLEGNDGLGGLSPNSNYIVNSGGTLRVSLAGNTARSVTVNTGGIFNVSTSASHIVNLRNNNGYGLTLNYATLSSSGDTAVSLPISLTGTVAGQGGVRLISNPSAAFNSIGATTSPFDLGAVVRPFDIGRGTSTNAYDLRIRGPVGGGGASGGIVKTGAGTLRFDNAANPWTGTLEIRDGEVRVNASNALTGKPALLVTGGTFNTLGGQQHTFSSVSVTKGTLLGSNDTSTMLSPSYAFAVAAGDTATVSTTLADAPSTSATLTKSGAGRAILSNALTYTGQTIVSGGTLQLNPTAHSAILGTTTPATTVADVRAGRLVFDYTGNLSRAGTVVPLLRTGYASNFSTGPIRSSTATSSRGLGYLDDAANQQFVVAYTLYGDTDLSGTVNFDDLLAVAQSYSGTTNKTWSQGDFNYDSAVGFTDLLSLAQNYGSTALADGSIATDAARHAGFAADWALAQSLVPEPASVASLAIAAASLRRRRR